MSLFNSELVGVGFDAIVVMYDAEPDDNAALLMLAIALKRCEKQTGVKIPLLLIVGEGDVEKRGMATNQANLLGLSCTIVQGPLSQKKFPLEMTNCFNANYSSGESIYFETDAVCCLSMFLEKSSNPLLIVLKPFAELIRVPNTLLAKATCAFYGSFNFATTCKAVSPTIVAQLINGSFKKCIVFETFLAMGADNNLLPKNAKELYDLLDEKKKTPGPFIHYFNGLEASIEIWNNSIASKQLSGIVPTALDLEKNWNDVQKRTSCIESLNRSLKIVANIGADSRQMVFADTGLLACILATGVGAVKSGTVVRCSLSFDPVTKYTKVEPNVEGNVFVLQNMDKKLLIKAFCDALQE